MMYTKQDVGGPWPHNNFDFMDTNFTCHVQLYDNKQQFFELTDVWSLQNTIQVCKTLVQYVSTACS